MKKLFTILTMVVMAIVTYSQAPQKLSYQAVIRNSSGQLVTNHAVGMKISILQGSASGTVVYSETYSPVPQTNTNGLVSVEIGGGTQVTGTFSSINWSSGTYYLKTEADPAGGTNYTVVGTSQLVSVPYALYSKTSATATDAVTLAGNQTITGLKTFNSDILVNGLTIGRGTGAIQTNTAAGNHALHSNSTGKSNTAMGNHALYNNAGGSYNTAVGDSANFSNISGNYNTAFGVNSLYSNTIGSQNTAFGYKALAENTSASYNTAIGMYALYDNTTGRLNTAVGNYTLLNNELGSYNTAIGGYALWKNTTGYNNTANGSDALYENTTGMGNVGIGSGVLHENINGSHNTAIGTGTFYNKKSGDNNIAVGSAAGYLNSSGYGNVFLGNQAGYYETGSNKLFIDNQKRANDADARVKALMYGVFDANPANQVLTVNGKLGINTITPAYQLDVNGEITSHSANGFRIRDANYSTFLRNDGSDFYILTTSSGDPDGTWNTLRPFIFHLADGTTYIGGQALTVLHGGNVGIGTYSPQCPLDISGQAALGTHAYGYLNKDGLTGKYTANPGYSIRAAWSILAAEFHAISDARVKNILGTANNHKNLELLENLDLIEFSYIDTYSYGNQSKYGFVAQEIGKIIPEAIAKSSEFIPDIFCSATEFSVGSNKQITIKLGKPHNFSDGDLVRIYLDGQVKESPVRVLSDTDFIVDEIFSEPEFVFIYGRKVNDFCSLDYDQIFIMGIGAIQELSRLNKSLKNDISALNTENSSLNKEVTKLIAENNFMKEEIAQLKSLRKDVDDLKRTVRRRANIR